ncbi:dynein light chain type 1-domain-containing protein [Mrakia frigida]|uniref:dynein light chain n=1 Tax=Mrakia frigida TaxID=29902 RepID=UPI003FCC13C2
MSAPTTSAEQLPVSNNSPASALETAPGATPGRVSTSGGVGVTTRSAIIKNIDMSDDLAQEAVDVASAALEKYNIEKDIAMHLKKEFDRRYGGCWNCVVGKNYGSFVTHETKHFIYFYLGQIAILLWKSS